MAQQAPAFQILGRYPEALVALSRDANLTAQYGKSPQLFAAAVEKNPQAYGKLAANARDIAAVSANAQVFNLIAQNSAALQSLAQNHAALQAASARAAGAATRNAAASAGNIAFIDCLRRLRRRFSQLAA